MISHETKNHDLLRVHESRSHQLRSMISSWFVVGFFSREKLTATQSSWTCRSRAGGELGESCGRRSAQRRQDLADWSVFGDWSSRRTILSSNQRAPGANLTLQQKCEPTIAPFSSDLAIYVIDCHSLIHIYPYLMNQTGIWPAGWSSFAHAWDRPRSELWPGIRDRKLQKQYLYMERLCGMYENP